MIHTFILPCTGYKKFAIISSIFHNNKYVVVALDHEESYSDKVVTDHIKYLEGKFPTAHFCIHADWKHLRDLIQTLPQIDHRIGGIDIASIQPDSIKSFLETFGDGGFWQQARL